MNLRLQTTEDTTAIKALQTGLQQIQGIAEHIMDVFQSELENFQTPE